MTEQEGLAGLRGLQQDLIALDESRLRNVDRLWADLESRIEEFRNLLDKPSKNESSRKKILSGITYLAGVFVAYRCFIVPS